MLRHAAITGWGHYLPEKVLSNKDLEPVVDTSDEWIRSRTGISERRIAAPGETTSSMCAIAGRQALQRAELDAREVDLVICATTTPDHLLPATSCLVQQKLDAANAGAFDLNAACTGSLAALIVGTQFIQCGTYNRVLVVAGETLSRFLNWKDRSTSILFGDGAAAVLLEATEQDCGVLSTALGCRGDVEHMLAIEAGGCSRPATAETVAHGDHYVRMRGNELFKFAVRGMTYAAKEAVAKANLMLKDIHKIIPHQANLRIITATQEALELTAAQVFVNVERYGNTGTASVPIALAELLATEPVQPGDHVLLVAFGGGVTWASALVRWADVAAIIATRGKCQANRFQEHGKGTTFTGQALD
jgi:3-oxoacyl-[acyl-carrier-protein] synthase-3